MAIPIVYRMSGLLLAAAVFLLRSPAALGFCPIGFDAPDQFPEEWGIPQWPTNMTPDEAGKLITVRFDGFRMTQFNEEFLEGPGESFSVQGKPSFWQASGKYFLYWCDRFKKWRIAGISGFDQNKNGNCLAFASDGIPERDILNASLIKGWLEVENGKWEVRKDAGVAALGKLSDQFAATESSDEASEDDAEGDDNATEAAAECASQETEGGGFEGSQNKANCPVMPVVRKVKQKVKEKVVAAGAAASQWVRMLLPQLLGPAGQETTSAEEAQPKAAAAPSAGEGEGEA